MLLTFPRLLPTAGRLCWRDRLDGCPVRQRSIGELGLRPQALRWHRLRWGSRRHLRLSWLGQRGDHGKTLCARHLQEVNSTSITGRLGDPHPAITVIFFLIVEQSRILALARLLI